jgi:hypothetical protein
MDEFEQAFDRLCETLKRFSELPSKIEEMNRSLSGIDERLDRIVEVLQ